MFMIRLVPSVLNKHDKSGDRSVEEWWRALQIVKLLFGEAEAKICLEEVEKEWTGEVELLYGKDGHTRPQDSSRCLPLGFFQKEGGRGRSPGAACFARDINDAFETRRGPLKCTAFVMLSEQY
jgi:hypothetical protein